jgi:hypothetical protein
LVIAIIFLEIFGGKLIIICFSEGSGPITCAICLEGAMKSCGGLTAMVNTYLIIIINHLLDLKWMYLQEWHLNVNDSYLLKFDPKTISYYRVNVFKSKKKENTKRLSTL